MKNVICLILLTFAGCTGVHHESKTFVVHTNEVLGENTEFWKASGTDLLFALAEEPSGQFLLDRMGETKSNVYLRNHATLSEKVRNNVQVGIKVYSEDEDGNPVYDFTRVNRIFREFVKRGQKPVVECDYIPEALLHDKGSIGNDEGMSVKNAGPKDWKKWHDLLVAFVQNLKDEFGAEEIRTWYFEVWNEPDGWNTAQIDVFYKMYDLFVDAVKSVDDQLKVGGPAAYHMFFLKNFLEHVAYGTNHVTGKQGTQIDFISYHIYGLSGGWLNGAPLIKPSVQRFTQQTLWIQRMVDKYDGLFDDVEFHINEWGMSSNFARTVAENPDLYYRNSEESALFLVKLVDGLYAIEDNYNFSTDMLLYWGGPWEDAKDQFFIGNRCLTTAGHTPKPIQTGFEMLAQLGIERLVTKGNRQGERIGIMATKSSPIDVEIVLYNYNETDDDWSIFDDVEMEISGLPDGKYVIEEYALDRKNNNTYREWERQGKPEKAADADLERLRNAADLSVIHTYTKKSKDGLITYSDKLQRHSMKLVKITKQENESKKTK